MISLLLSSTAGVALTSICAPRNTLLITIITQSSILFLLSFLLINQNTSHLWSNLCFSLGNDFISSPLLVVSFWLTPVSILANTSTLQNNSTQSFKNFIALTLIIQFALIITFTASNLLVFFIGFESTLIPTLLLITRWGNQTERFEAGYFFIFYTLISSLPFFLALLLIYNKLTSLSLFLPPNSTSFSFILSFACMGAFLVKAPIFGFHLWLPKAHVEAPVAGSMILAAILLKMGGYGFIRLYIYFWSSLHFLASPFLIAFCCWGGTLTSLICLTQTDLKSLIAYSSVSHMSFLIATISSGTNWSISAAILIMVAHALTSSALFASANILYERSGSRTLFLSRGFKSSQSLLPFCWLFFLSSNLGLPPFPNSIGEVLSFSTILSWSTLLLPLIITSLTLTAIFSLSVFQIICSGWSFYWNANPYNLLEREIVLLFLHGFPLLSLILALSLIS
uniref:NADH-ubiquinone oxidoreductase chain 4 n=1 Tax=Ophiomusa kimblae TaxID=3135533 RepID=A0AAU6PXD7_9ECHI